MKKRPVVVFFALLLLSVCAVAIIPVSKGLCIARPDSLQHPPVPHDAEQITAGQSTFKPDEDYAGKLLQFQTSDAPAIVYNFYVQSLEGDGWLQDAAQKVTALPNRIDTKFTWECGFDTPNVFAILWFHSEVIASGKTITTLNYEYIP